MNAGGHLLVAGGCWWAYTTVLTGSAAALGNDVATMVTLPVALIGGLLPDVDHPHSTFGRRIRSISIPLSLFSHRGITHSLWAVISLAYLLFHAGYFIPLWGQALIIGYLSHLLADSLTPSGLRPFWPLPYRTRIHPIVFAVTTGIIMFYVGVL